MVKVSSIWEEKNNSILYWKGYMDIGEFSYFSVLMSL